MRDNGQNPVGYGRWIVVKMASQTRDFGDGGHWDSFPGTDTSAFSEITLAERPPFFAPQRGRRIFLSAAPE
jgi:hypothetical protein